MTGYYRKRQERGKAVYDILIKDGFVIDGTGEGGKKRDIGIAGDRIVFIGDASITEGTRVIRADGSVVAPGFIDIHSHSDFNLLADPTAESKVCQGVTTEVVGQCGLSGAPLEGAVWVRRKNELAHMGIPVTWSSLDEYLQRLEEAKPIVNVATLIGHGNLRAAVVGYENRLATGRELRRMSHLLSRDLAMGAYGLSTGLMYPPGVYASGDELLTLNRIVAEFQGIYATHLRSEGDQLVEAIQEALSLAERAGVSLQISHLKTYGKKNWGKLPTVFSLIETFRSRGLAVHVDRYPYTASSTGLDVLLPSWVWEGGQQEELNRLADPACRMRMTESLQVHNGDPEFWDNVMVSAVKSSENRRFEGKTLREISVSRRCSPWDAVYELLREEELDVEALFFFMSEENLGRILAKEYCMIGSDSAARSVSGILRRGKPHPRGFGTFPRILHQWAGKGKGFPLETAIHKMTGLPAEKLGLRNRSVIREENFADLVVFNPSAIQDRADYGQPFQLPVGIDYVIINGTIVIEEGRLTGNRPGTVLRKGS
ncbi:MAG: D-aminoacylase [Deltaproteobacteria bacterium]|nr:D-aminoacylase [Deltaproteobacteria bacterium]